jgi:GT2 family glycosyltransferase
MLVSALLLNYRSPKDTIRSARALLRQTMLDQLEIFVIDNHSLDDSIGVIRGTFEKEPRVRIIESAQNIGYGKGNNRAAQYAKGKYLLIINPDNELEPEGLEQMVHAMEADGSIGILAPRLVYQDGTLRDSVRAFPTMWDVFIKRTLLRYFFAGKMDRYLQTKVDKTKMRDVDWVVGACFLIRADLFKELGGFDPQFFLFFEDIDLCRRVHERGKRVVFFPQVMATDRRRRLSQGGILTIFTKWTVREHLRSSIRYFYKWGIRL